MGFGTIIAGVYFLAVLIVSGYVITDTVNRMSETSYESVLTAGNIQMNRLGSSASITEFSISPPSGSDGGVINVNLLNTGEVKIVAEDFSKIDILLTYTDTVDETQTYWCSYQADGYDANTPTQVQWWTNGNPSPAVVDPSNWDPSKTLSITITLPSSQPIVSGSDVYLKVVLPGGSSTTESCSFALATTSTTTGATTG